jgi:hypothetical protein
VKIEPKTEIHDVPVNNSPQVRKSRSKEKEHVNYLIKPKTRAKNKLILNSKALFKPSLKKDNMIILDDDITEKIHKKTKKGKKKQPVPKIKFCHLDDETPEITK